MKLEPGMLVRSKAGRDKDQVYVVISVDKEYAYAADGAQRPLRHMKKKNKKHLQPILKMRLAGTPDDKAIREIIRNCTREGEPAQCRV